MSQIEGKLVMGEGNVVRHNASYFEEITSTDASWHEITFVDHNGDAFASEYIRIHAQSLSVAELSFDQRDTGSHPRVVQGEVGANGAGHQEILMRNKKATSIFVRRKSVANVTVRVYAWR